MLSFALTNDALLKVIQELESLRKILCSTEDQSDHVMFQVMHWERGLEYQKHLVNVIVAEHQQFIKRDRYSITSHAKAVLRKWQTLMIIRNAGPSSRLPLSNVTNGQSSNNGSGQQPQPQQQLQPPQQLQQPQQQIMKQEYEEVPSPPSPSMLSQFMIITMCLCFEKMRDLNSLHITLNDLQKKFQDDILFQQMNEKDWSLNLRFTNHVITCLQFIAPNANKTKLITSIAVLCGIRGCVPGGGPTLQSRRFYRIFATLTGKDGKEDSSNMGEEEEEEMFDTHGLTLLSNVAEALTAGAFASSPTLNRSSLPFAEKPAKYPAFSFPQKSVLVMSTNLAKRKVEEDGKLLKYHQHRALQHHHEMQFIKREKIQPQGPLLKGPSAAPSEVQSSLSTGVMSVELMEC
eukprot:scaffold1945_cov181-Ochromonas_danica.AAC.14